MIEIRYRVGYGGQASNTHQQEEEEEMEEEQQSQYHRREGFEETESEEEVSFEDYVGGSREGIGDGGVVGVPEIPQIDSPVEGEGEDGEGIEQAQRVLHEDQVEGQVGGGDGGGGDESVGEEGVRGGEGVQEHEVQEDEEQEEDSDRSMRIEESAEEVVRVAGYKTEYFVTDI